MADGNPSASTGSGTRPSAEPPHRNLGECPVGRTPQTATAAAFAQHPRDSAPVTANRRAKSVSWCTWWGLLPRITRDPLTLASQHCIILCSWNRLHRGTPTGALLLHDPLPGQLL
eukprot:scaffold71690_cov32-Tisochrysis_lutea.AAC.2